MASDAQVLTKPKRERARRRSGTVLLGFTLAIYNLDRVHSCPYTRPVTRRVVQAVLAPKARAEVIEASASSPPPA